MIFFKSMLTQFSTLYSSEIWIHNNVFFFKLLVFTNDNHYLQLNITKENISFGQFIIEICTTEPIVQEI